MVHTILFPREPVAACEAIVAYIDLETNSLDVLSGKIVEIGALAISFSGWLLSYFFYGKHDHQGCGRFPVEICMILEHVRFRFWNYHYFAHRSIHRIC